MGVGARIFCWASPTGLRNLDNFLVTFLDMLRNNVTFKSKSVKNVYYLLKGVQIWYQNNIKQLAHYHWDIEILQQLPADGKKMLFYPWRQVN